MPCKRQPNYTQHKKYEGKEIRRLFICSAFVVRRKPWSRRGYDRCVDTIFFCVCVPESVPYHSLSRQFTKHAPLVIQTNQCPDNHSRISTKAMKKKWAGFVFSGTRFFDAIIATCMAKTPGSQGWFCISCADLIVQCLTLGYGNPLDMALLWYRKIFNAPQPAIELA